MKVTVKHARQILKDKSLTDEEIQTILNSLYYLAEKVFDEPMEPFDPITIDPQEIINNMGGLISSVFE